VVVVVPRLVLQTLLRAGQVVDKGVIHLVQQELQAPLVKGMEVEDHLG
jgi:hypothetical protein